MTPRLITTFFLGITLAQPASAQCLKEVFNRWCLGAEITEADTSRARHQFQSGGSTIYSYSDDNEQTAVRIFNGRIENVMRSYKPANRLKFNDLRSSLVNLYGEPKMLRNLPQYVDTEQSMENAINAGRGRITAIWQFDGWGIRLLWFSHDSINLIYQHDAISRERRDKNPNPQGF